jgi:hypothetical protein
MLHAAAVGRGKCRDGLGKEREAMATAGKGSCSSERHGARKKMHAAVGKIKNQVEIKIEKGIL